MFSDDTAIVACILKWNERKYKEVIANFVKCCGRNNLQINGIKTKETVMDFCHKGTLFTPVNIQEVEIDLVSVFKYLDVHWTGHSKLSCP